MKPLTQSGFVPLPLDRKYLVRDGMRVNALQKQLAQGRAQLEATQSQVKQAQAAQDAIASSSI
ncbi:MULTISPECIES: hypothetical protein [unclassified Coleofasciculus]|uniref:hypothetical protein n=1 Tax=unclassified Coleofasciculus TaxID=2692782 RepID=UPI001881D481|nr:MULTISPECIES: hypothetical protein [unclassified Coleofasciculus]MBE9129952.1 hypothetical protein [Coleofasciculus sp. LEGE 07081]MBE9150405.1 hypothetical protein [Coleofasciculus sp. LEGE 07092]